MFIFSLKLEPTLLYQKIVLKKVPSWSLPCANLFRVDTASVFVMGTFHTTSSPVPLTPGVPTRPANIELK